MNDATSQLDSFPANISPLELLPQPARWYAEWWSRGEDNSKLAKTEQRQVDFKTHILSLAHSTTSGHQTCAGASTACINICSTSRAGIAAAFPDRIMAPRIAKTRALFSFREDSVEAITSEIIRRVGRDSQQGYRSAIRWNGSTDLPYWSTSWTRRKISPIEQLHNEYPDSEQYDYGKILAWYARPEFRRLYDAGIYSVCWSRSEDNQDKIVELLRAGQDCSVVFHEIGLYSGNKASHQRLPTEYTLNGQRFRVLDGDLNDIRSLDKGRMRNKFGRIIGLRLKSFSRQQRQDAIDSGFSLPAFP